VKESQSYNFINAFYRQVFDVTEKISVGYLAGLDMSINPSSYDDGQSTPTQKYSDTSFSLSPNIGAGFSSQIGDGPFTLEGGITGTIFTLQSTTYKNEVKDAEYTSVEKNFTGVSFSGQNLGLVFAPSDQFSIGVGNILTTNLTNLTTLVNKFNLSVSLKY
jgi:hypothetical protein